MTRDLRIDGAVAAPPLAARLSSERGFTLVEMLIAAMVMMAVTAAVFQMMNPAQGIFKAQPEVSDEQQRLRVGVETLRGDIVMAGAGSYMGSTAGSLYNFFAPVMPYRSGDLNDDPSQGVFYRDNTISLLYVPPTPAQTSGSPIGNNSQEIEVNPQFNCSGTSGNSNKGSICGFTIGMRVLLMDNMGEWETTTLTNIQDSALHLQHSGKLLNEYPNGMTITQVRTATYYLKADKPSNTYQLMFYDGYQTDLPIVDNVVKLKFEYFGEPQPPRMLPPGPNNCLTATCTGPWTTYGPKPPDAATDLITTDEYGKGENCAFSMATGALAPRLAVLGDGTSPVKLTAASLTDGPWCPNKDSVNRYDADLLRVRRVRVSMRVQVGLDSLRGPAGVLFTNGGTATSAQRYVPDQEISFDVTPRNMNLGR
jgi:type II secretory pathway pseudopilin PulG